MRDAVVTQTCQRLVRRCDKSCFYWHGGVRLVDLRSGDACGEAGLLAPCRGTCEVVVPSKEVDEKLFGEKEVKQIEHGLFIASLDVIYFPGEVTSLSDR